MKRTFTLLSLLLLTFGFLQLQAQSRVNASVIQLDSTSTNLSNIKDWRFMESTGKWNEFPDGVPNFLSGLPLAIKAKNIMF